MLSVSDPSEVSSETNVNKVFDLLYNLGNHLSKLSVLLLLEAFHELPEDCLRRFAKLILGLADKKK